MNNFQRSQWHPLRSAMLIGFILSIAQLTTVPIPADDAAQCIHLGNRRELFVDGFLVETLAGARQQVQHPTPKEVAIVHDQPWEGNTSYYHTVFRDADRYRMYYRGAHANLPVITASHQVVCYAESPDGIHWTKPQLGLHEFDGSKDNNIIWTGIGAHNFAPFRDANPNSRAEARYKAIGQGEGGLYAFQSPDAIHWSLMHPKPVITKGAFDSQNLAFYDARRGQYLDFHRGFRDGLRAIMTCTSADFIHWTEPEWIEYQDDRQEHLYTNQTAVYPRAPQLLVAFPKRFVPSRNPLNHRNSGVSDIVFMTSRDGKTFHRWGEAFLRPGPQRERWINRNNFVAWGIVETASDRPGTPDELSFYSMEGYYQGESCQMRRYTLRPDGFVSVSAPLEGGTLLTKALTFDLPDTPPPPPAPPRMPSTVRVEAENPIRGSGSLEFTAPTILNLGETKNLGPQATLAVAVRGVPSGLRRLFSTYNGGPTTPDELYFDVNSGGPINKADGYSIRFNYNGVTVGAKFADVGDWSAARDANAIYHLAATWSAGQVMLYFDGRLVGSGKMPQNELKSQLGNLRFGEDYPPTLLTNEPFLGTADDILVLRRALSGDEVKQLAQFGPSQVIRQESDGGLLITMDELASAFADSMTKDGRQTTTGPDNDQPGEVELRINFSTSAAGSIRCEIQQADGEPIPGFTLDDCDEIYGDSLDYPIRWGGVSEVKSLAGKPIRLRFELKDADLFALRFGRPPSGENSP